MIAFHSLRQTALVWITILLALVGLATLMISYRLAKDQAAEFLDGQLRQVALNVESGCRMPPRLLASIKTPKSGSR